MKIRGCSNECQITALLHDVLEDDKSGVYTEDFLMQKHVPESIIIARKCLTHHKDTEFIAEYKAKFKQVRQNLNKDLTIKRLISVINRISHFK